MISECTSCHRPFWRYRRDFPPAGFCSLPCQAEGPKKPKQEPIIPPMPATILDRMKHHRVHQHGTDSMLARFDCRLCEELEADYSESLSFWYARITADIATDAETRRSVVYAREAS